jgi:hypothetical protein
MPKLSPNRFLLSTAVLVLLAACAPGLAPEASGLPSSTPLPAKISTATPPPDWRNYERPLAQALLQFAFDPVCEWQPLGGQGATVYLWAYCEERGGQGTSLASAVRAVRDPATGFTQVEWPGEDPLAACRRMKELFPPAALGLLESFSAEQQQALIDHARLRQTPDDPPLAARIPPGAYAGLTLPEPGVTAAFPEAPTRRWKGSRLLLAYAASDDHLYVSQDFGAPQIIAEWDSCSAAPVSLAWSPDGQTLAYMLVDPAGSTYLGLYDRKEGVSRYHPVGAPGRDLAWSPDGRWVGWIEGNAGAAVLRLYSLADESEQVFQPAGRFWWLRDSLGVVFQTRVPGGAFLRGDISGAQTELTIPRLTRPETQVVGFLRPNGALLVWEVKRGAGAGQLWRVTLDGKHETLLIALSGQMQFGSLAVSPDARLLAISACGDPADLETCVTKQVRMAGLVNEDIPMAEVLSWTPDDTNLVSLDWDGITGRPWLVVDRIMTGERLYRAELPLSEVSPALAIGWGK